ncbi:MAG TPA: methyltransferase [Gaiellaceae bacterium]|nr:methyltransferase [Gaiellaceae bacterium]
MVITRPGQEPGRHRVLARTIRGIEDIVAAEVAELPAAVLGLGHREVDFELGDLGRALELGTADDVFLVVDEGPPVGRKRPDLTRLRPSVDLDAAARRIGARRRVAGRSFDVSLSFLGRRSYSRFDAEDALGRHVAAATGWRYRSRRDGDPGATSLSLRVHLTDAGATVGVRLGARPLHRRPYRVVSRPGALHPPLARAMVRLARPCFGARLADPFCGTGTIAVEAKLCRPDLRVVASDVDGDAVRAARTNVAAAGVEVSVRRAPAASLDAADCVVSNPPWGRRVALRGGEPDLARALPPGGRVVLLTARGAPPWVDVDERRTVRVAGRLAELLVGRRR